MYNAQRQYEKKNEKQRKEKEIQENVVDQKPHSD